MGGSSSCHEDLDRQDLDLEEDGIDRSAGYLCILLRWNYANTRPSNQIPQQDGSTTLSKKNREITVYEQRVGAS